VHSDDDSSRYGIEDDICLHSSHIQFFNTQRTTETECNNLNIHSCAVLFLQKTSTNEDSDINSELMLFAEGVSEVIEHLIQEVPSLCVAFNKAVLEPVLRELGDLSKADEDSFIPSFLHLWIVPLFGKFYIPNPSSPSHSLPRLLLHTARALENG